MVAKIWKSHNFSEVLKSNVLSTKEVQNLPILLYLLQFLRSMTLTIQPNFKMVARFQKKSKFFRCPRGVLLSMQEIQKNIK